MQVNRGYWAGQKLGSRLLLLPKRKRSTSMLYRLTIAMLTVAMGASCTMAQSITAQRPDAPSATREAQRLQHPQRKSEKYAYAERVRDLPDAPSYKPLTDHEKFRLFVETSTVATDFFICWSRSDCSAGVWRTSLRERLQRLRTELRRGGRNPRSRARFSEGICFRRS